MYSASYRSDSESYHMCACIGSHREWFWYRDIPLGSSSYDGLSVERIPPQKTHTVQAYREWLT